MSSQAPTALSVIVIGGGIGGLAAAILLAQAGHHITVFEHRDESYQSRSTGGLCLTKNSVRWIQAMGLEQDLDRIADTGHDTMIMKYDTGKVIRSLHRTLPSVLILKHQSACASTWLLTWYQLFDGSQGRLSRHPAQESNRYWSGPSLRIVHSINRRLKQSTDNHTFRWFGIQM